ncbi:hypothetical protein JCM11251_004171 [Rhodosporidiobolus azoricus]
MTHPERALSLSDLDYLNETLSSSSPSANTQSQAQAAVETSTAARENGAADPTGTATTHNENDGLPASSTAPTSRASDSLSTFAPASTSAAGVPGQPQTSLASLLATLSSVTSATSALGSSLPSSSLPPVDDDNTAEAELSEVDVAALLQRLDQADASADEIEGRLDRLLEGLDGMLGALGMETAGQGAGDEEEHEDSREKGE